MTDAEWAASMRRVLGPHLETMASEVQQSWGPEVDPEAMLLRWLCQRHNLEVPPISVRRRQKAEAARGSAEDSDESSARQQAPHSARAEPSKPKAKEPQPPNSARLPPIGNRHTEAKRASPAEWRPGPGQSLPILEEESEGSPTSPSQSPKHQLSAPAMALDLGVKALTTKPWKSNLSINLPECKPWERTLQTVQDRVVSDERRHTSHSELLKANNQRMHDMMAYMHQEMRGQFLSKVPLLSDKVLDAKTQFRLVSCLKPQTFERGKHIITEGEVGDKLYIIERGVCEVLKKLNDREVTIGQLSKGAFFGEIAVLYDMPRTATVRTQTAVIALALSRADILQQLSAEDLERMKLIARTQVFGSVPLLADLDAEKKAKVALALKSQKWHKGALLAGQNHITSRMYIIEQGNILMTPPKRNKSATAAQELRLGPGQYFGMRGLLFEAPMGFTITADSDVVMTLSISYEELVNTAGPELAERQEMAARLHRSIRAHLVRQIPAIKRLADENFQAVFQQAEEVKFQKWNVIFKQGSTLRYVYVLENGKLSEYGGLLDQLVECNGQVKFKKWNVIADQDASSEYVYELKSGQVAVFDGELGERRPFDLKVSTAEAARLDVNCPEHVTPGEYFGAECLSSKSAIAPYTLVALTDVTLIRFPPSSIWAVQEEQRQFLSRIQLFSEDVLTKEEQFMLVGKLKPWSFPAGRYIIQEGEIGDMLFIIERGVCDACKLLADHEVVLTQLKKGAFFGELATMFDMPRTASVRAATHVTALSLTREDIFSLITEEKITKMQILAKAQVFGSIPILAGLTAAAKNTIARRLQRQFFRKGEVIIDPEDVADRLYIVESGSVMVQCGDVEKGQLLLAGMSFGMDRLLYEEPYDIKVIAQSDEVKTLSCTLPDIFASAGTGEQEALERQIRRALNMWLLKSVCLPGESDDRLATALRHCDVLEFEAGATVFEEKDELNSAPSSSAAVCNI
ncbi:Pka-R2 [Symbiodinium pilosum]|uniref:Pka-R2 protein n=1 Tax=Symbiodinium pilosum TaxID=2952 RepID=A0A812JI79_SYMPI|nr:Pka-R2 [Symbiodinium pilosum]